MATPFLLKAGDVNRLRIAIEQRKAFLATNVQTQGEPGPPGSSAFSVGNFGDPNGNQTMAGYGMYFDADGSFWFHNDTGTNNTNWELKS